MDTYDVIADSWRNVPLELLGIVYEYLPAYSYTVEPSLRRISLPEAGCWESLSGEEYSYRGVGIKAQENFPSFVNAHGKVYRLTDGKSRNEHRWGVHFSNLAFVCSVDKYHGETSITIVAIDGDDVSAFYGSPPAYVYGRFVPYALQTGLFLRYLKHTYKPVKFKRLHSGRDSEEPVVGIIMRWGVDILDGVSIEDVDTSSHEVVSTPHQHPIMRWGADVLDGNGSDEQKKELEDASDGTLRLKIDGQNGLGRGFTWALCCADSSEPDSGDSPDD